MWRTLDSTTQRHVNSQGTHGLDKKERALHQNQAIHGEQHSKTDQKEETRRLHKELRRWGVQEYNLFRPNRPVSQTIALQQQIHHGNGVDWQQRHPGWTREEQKG